MRINIPNQITLGRLVLALVFFAFLSFYSPAIEARNWIIPACFWIFLIAVITDVIDGWLARTWKQVTSFGRIFDPVVDKVIVCGAFIFFASPIFYDPQSGRNISGVYPWMVVLILLRELLVSAIRSFSEAQGTVFGANWVGKIKMFVQSASVCVVLGVLAWYPEKLAWLRVTCIWLTVVVTGLSIIGYVKQAHAFVLSASALGAAPDETHRPRTEIETPIKEVPQTHSTPPPSPTAGDSGGSRA
jgi:CDP-diacylglycerol--glycerol-3-phosphate 3-phosphatidyltransferase